MAPAPTVSHQTVVGNIYFLLRAFAEEHGTGTFFIAPLDVMLPTGDVAQPDVFFLTNDEAARARGAKRVQGAPAFLIEVLSPGSLRQDTITKRDLYERNGVREYWIVDPRRRTLAQLMLQADGHYRAAELTATDEVRGVVLEGFTASVADLFGD